jgi:hypothetical protein
MNEQAKRIQKPRCFLVYALAPENLPSADANRIFNDFIGDRDLPLVVYHDHFIGQPSGIAIFYVDKVEARDACSIRNTWKAGGLTFSHWCSPIAQPLLMNKLLSRLKRIATWIGKIYRRKSVLRMETHAAKPKRQKKNRMSFDKIVEEPIKKAQERGEFDNPPGKGKPIDLSAYFEMPEDVRVAQSVLKNAGFKSREVDLLN